MAEEKTLSLFTGLSKELQNEITKLTYSFYERNQEDYILQYYTEILAEAAVIIFSKYKQEPKEGFNKEQWKELEGYWSNYIMGNYRTKIIFNEKCSYYKIERVYKQKKARGLKMNTLDQWIEIFTQFLYYGRITSDQVDICVDDLSATAATIYNYGSKLNEDQRQAEWYNWIVYHHPELRMSSKEKYFKYSNIYNYMYDLLDISFEIGNIVESLLKEEKIVNKYAINDIKWMAVEMHNMIYAENIAVKQVNDTWVKWLNEYASANNIYLNPTKNYYNFDYILQLIDNTVVYYSVQEAADEAVQWAFYIPLTEEEKEIYYYFNQPEQIIEYKKIKKLPINISSNSDLYELIKKYRNDVITSDWNTYWIDYKTKIDLQLVYPTFDTIIQLAWSDTLEALQNTEWFFTEQPDIKFEAPSTVARKDIEYKFDIIDFNKNNITWKLTRLDSDYERTDRRSWITLYEKDKLGNYTIKSSLSNGRNEAIDLFQDEKPAYITDEKITVSKEMSQQFSGELLNKQYMIKCSVAYSYGKLSHVFDENYFLFFDIVGDKNSCVWTPKQYRLDNFYVGLPREEVIEYMYHDFNYGLVDLMFERKLTYTDFEHKYKTYCLKSPYCKEYLHYFLFYEPLKMWGSLNELKKQAMAYAQNAYNLRSMACEINEEGERLWSYNKSKGWYNFNPSSWKVNTNYQNKKEISDFTKFLDYFKENYGEEGVEIWYNESSTEFLEIAAYYFMKYMSTVGNLDPLHGSSQIHEYSEGRIYNPYKFNYNGVDEIKNEIILDTSKWLDLTSYNVITGSSQYRVLYPPILESSQPAFAIEDNKTYKIYFKLSDYTDFNSVGHVAFRIIKQSDSTSVVNYKKWYDGIIYVPHNLITKEGPDLYSASIISGKQVEGSADLISQHWENNAYYKIQARLGVSPSMWTSDKNKDTKEEYIVWRDIESANGRFSDWSTTMIIKAIPKPKVSILNKEENLSEFEIHNLYNIEYTNSPIFYGFYDPQVKGKSQSENLYEYKFDLYHQDVLLETSNWIKYIDYLNSTEHSVTTKHRFLTALTFQEEYKVMYTIKTVNGYEDSEEYTFRTQENFLDYFGPISDAYLKIESDEEEAVNLIYFNSGYYIDNHIKIDNGIAGNFIITRRAIGSSQWEDLFYFTPHTLNSIYRDQLVYKDFSIESGVKYQYGIQKEYEDGLRSRRIESNFVVCNFEHCYLLCDNVQLKLKFNTQINSFKYTVMAQKQDTLGGKYPNILINGQSHYAEFPINALISLHSDENFYFFENRYDGLYYENELVVPYEKYRKDAGISTILHRKTRGDRAELLGQQEFLALDTFNTDLTSDNIFIERKFREKVEAFLNNGKPKLFKSATEGNFIVSLLNISFSPNQELGRALYSVSGTAYEIAENSLQNLVKYNILSKGNFNPFYGQGFSIAQVKGYYVDDTNLIDLVVADLENRSYSDVGISLKTINQVNIEHYPKINLDNEINRINYEINTSEDPEQIRQLKYEMQDLEELQNKLAETIQYEPIEIKMNKNNIIVSNHLPYNTKITNNQNINQLYIQDNNKESGNLSAAPVIVNFATDIMYHAINYFGLSVGWGSQAVYQFKGNLVKPKSLMSHLYFDYDFENNKPAVFKYVNDRGTCYYNTLNLFEVLRYELKEHIAKRLGIRSKMLTAPISDEYKQFLDQPEVPVWEYKTKEETYFIAMTNIDSMYLEAPTGTHFQYTENENGDNLISDFVIGHTGNLTLDPIAYEMFYENEKFNAIFEENESYVPILMNLSYTINIVKKVGG